MIKVKVDRATIGHIENVCAFRNHSTVTGSVFTDLVAEEQLSKVEKLCAGKKHQKQATLTFSFAQLACLEIVMRPRPTHPSTLVVLEYVINPIVKQIFAYTN